MPTSKPGSINLSSIEGQLCAIGRRVLSSSYNASRPHHLASVATRFGLHIRECQTCGKAVGRLREAA